GQIAAKVGEADGFEVTVWDKEEIRKAKLGGLLGVNRGSTQAPRFLLLRYEPDKPKATIALVGKGITFDSGGLSLKPPDAMIGMKGDMGGAAAVLGAFRAIAALGVKVRVLGFLPITDNMTGGDATRVGDVLTMRNGKTVEVLNTDAEGRLILADALSLATEAAPDAIVDLATLTGACMVALGERTAGLMGNHQGWLDQVHAAASAVGEPTWQLPLPPYLRKKLDSEIADLKNITNTRYGGALAAGLFLQEFVGDGIPWTHIDIAGPADASEVDGEIVKGGTGFGVRTLVELLSTFSKPKRDEA
ncbi:MAG: leucyl aminopeptidase family protein, partial [Acidimicrobiales bacterium]